MTWTIETTDDFLRLLRERKDFREAARREILTNDLLDLPGDFREYKASTDDHLKDIKDSLKSVDNSLNALSGAVLEEKMSSRLRQRLGTMFQLTGPVVVWRTDHPVQPPSRAETYVEVKDATFSKGTIDEIQAQRLELIDMVLRGKAADGDDVHVAVEASGVINDIDITRARQTAEILKEVYGGKAIPVVYGYSIRAPQVRQAMQVADLSEVHIVLEHRRL